VSDKTTGPPSALHEWQAIAQRLIANNLCVFFDYDGTLTPIVATPNLAALSPLMAQLLRRLASRVPVGVVSGRELTDIRDKVGIENIYYAGNHGFEIWDPRAQQVALEMAVDILPALDEAHQRLMARLSALTGVLIEHKRFSLSVHYRLADRKHRLEIENAVDEIVASFSQLTKQIGKKVLEIRPRVEWNKGHAVKWILESMPTLSKIESTPKLPIYFGDDVTDEDAFRMLKGQGIGILVSESSRVTAADYTLRNPSEVAQLITQLVDELDRVDT
jgi:trehalose-phosphatase